MSGISSGVSCRPKCRRLAPAFCCEASLDWAGFLGVALSLAGELSARLGDLFSGADG
ncbi:MAG: hypothetical protein ACNYPH_03175 [Gammaproteobacteria bacterium WSBS_2016_MAG_OTU1]